MIEIEKYPCNDFNEARKRERHFYEFLNSNLNSIKPLITKEEQLIENCERVLLCYPAYYEKNKEVIIQRVKKYADNNKELISKRAKIYREENKQELKEK